MMSVKNNCRQRRRESYAKLIKKMCPEEKQEYDHSKECIEKNKQPNYKCLHSNHY